MPRFVVLEHDHPFLHWDLLLEHGEAARTWRLTRPPIPGVWIEAEEISLHRLEYLEYEGEISGGRGRVKRWDWGQYRLLSQDGDAESLLFRSRLGSGYFRIERVEAGKWKFLEVMTLTSDSV